MNIIIDESVSLGEQVFSTLGSVEVRPASAITNNVLQKARMLIIRSGVKVTEELCSGTPLKFIGTATSGTDHVDTEACERLGIGFASAPGSNADSVAAYVTAALVHCLERQRRSPRDCTLGIIGVGAVGTRVLHYAQALGMQCLLNDPPKQRLTKSDIFVPLEQILRKADAVTVHVPLTTGGVDPTYHLVNDAFLTRMREGALFCNTSRGDVVDETALRARRNRLGSVILDVWHNEPGISLDTVSIADIATPHIAGYSYDGKVRGTEMVFRAASAFFFCTKSDEPVPLPCTIDKETITIPVANNPLSAAIRAAYPICDDDAALRKCAAQVSSGRRVDISPLRGRYWKRRDFDHISFRFPEKVSAHQQSVLARLGFEMTDETVIAEEKAKR